MTASRILLLASILWLFGLHPAQAQAPTATTTTVDGAAAGKGTVILSVTHDEETGNKGWTSIYVDGKVPGASVDRHLLSSIDSILGIPRGSDFKDLYGRVYVLELAAGPHQIDGWHTSIPGGHVAPTSDPPPLVFEVADGEVVYLGNVHMVNRLARPSFVSPWVPVGGTPVVRDRRQIDIPIAEGRTPALKGRVQVRLLPEGTWGPSDPPTRTLRSPPPNIIIKPR